MSTAKIEQLLLFCDDPIDRIEREVRELRELCERLRKGQFAKISKISKEYDALKHEFETLKSAMCNHYTKGM